ncbi:flagellar filament capping protein FliD [Paenibacillus aurantiacus]|uniref:Flagellar hook-associated protein 2 n=1 Tax=Paenibacillus aurantiacus TaxID=1936118 RepID=A0ABV5KXB9_9BACL
MVGVNRLSGLVSGMDTESMVKALVSANSAKLNKMKQKQQLLEWKRTDYRDMNAKILDFKNTAFNMKLQSAYMTKTATSSQESAVTVSGTASATPGQYSIEVNSLAKGASLTTGKLGGANATLFTDGQSLVVGKYDPMSPGSQATIAVDSTTKVSDLVTKINAESSKTGVKVSYDSTLDRMFFISSKTGVSSNITMELQGGTTDLGAKLGLNSVSGSQSLTGTDLVGNAGDTLTMTVNGKTYDYTATATTKVNDLINQINSDFGSTGVTAFLDNSGKLAFNDPNYDSVKGPSVTFTGTLASNLGVDTLARSSQSSIQTFGQNAEVNFNGVKGSYETNTFTVAGMTVTAKAETTAPAKLIVNQDTDAIFNNIKSFIDKYNDLISTVNTKTSEKYDRNYQPLTAEQKESMKDDEVEKWEAKAKVGMLSRDQTLNSGMTSFRQAFSETISGISDSFNMLSQIGISSTLQTNGVVSGTYLDNGKIYINEAKLKDAIANNPDEVVKFFTASDGNSNSTAGDGLATRLYDKASALFNQITAKAGTAATASQASYAIGKEMNSLSDLINRETTRIETLQERYYAQFSRMESYMNKMNAQGSWLSGQTG